MENHEKVDLSVNLKFPKSHPQYDLRDFWNLAPNCVCRKITKIIFRENFDNVLIKKTRNSPYFQTIKLHKTFWAVINLWQFWWDMLGYKISAIEKRNITEYYTFCGWLRIKDAASGYIIWQRTWELQISKTSTKLLLP